jgi:hypothetical protein
LPPPSTNRYLYLFKEYILIVFDLICDEQHQFEGWFRNSEEFETQVETGLLSCPICGSEHVTKLLSPSRLNFGKAEKQALDLLAIQNDAQQLLLRINKYINTHFEDVGGDFADEARKIHYGETDERNIRGSATVDEAHELYEEGIDIFPIITPDDDEDKLN